ncbi:DUF6924 domain-containing protein [Phytoactinopolyspora halotolerans]
MLPKGPDLSLIFVRTDYGDDDAWQQALAAANAVYEDDVAERMGAQLQPVESPELANLTPHQLVALPREDYLTAIAVADEQAMRDHTVLFVDFDEYGDQIGRTFRSVPWEVELIVANLSLANMDFAEFADSVDSDGVFRGF